MASSIKYRATHIPVVEMGDDVAALVFYNMSRDANGKAAIKDIKKGFASIKKRFLLINPHMNDNLIAILGKMGFPRESIIYSNNYTSSNDSNMNFTIIDTSLL